MTRPFPTSYTSYVLLASLPDLIHTQEAGTAGIRKQGSACVKQLCFAKDMPPLDGYVALVCEIWIMRLISDFYNNTGRISLNSQMAHPPSPGAAFAQFL